MYMIATQHVCHPQLSKNNTVHFPTLKLQQGELAKCYNAMTRYVNKISNLRKEIKDKILDFRT